MFYCEKCGNQCRDFNDYYIRRDRYVCWTCSEKIKIITIMKQEVNKLGLTLEHFKKFPSAKHQYIKNKKIFYELKKISHKDANS